MALFCPGKILISSVIRTSVEKRNSDSPITIFPFINFLPIDVKPAFIFSKSV